MPAWAAAPHRNSLGLASRGPKSIMAPIPIKSRIGMASLASMPTSKSHWMIPWVSPMPSLTWLITPDRGRFTKIAPKPMGISSAGSKPFSMASQISSPPTTYMTTCCGVMDSTPCHKNSSPILPTSFLFQLQYLCVGSLPDIRKKRPAFPYLERRSGHFRQNQKATGTFMLVGLPRGGPRRLLPLTAHIVSHTSCHCQGPGRIF